MDYVKKIREIQKAENSEPCFRRGRKFCKYLGVLLGQTLHSDQNSHNKCEKIICISPNMCYTLYR